MDVARDPGPDGDHVVDAQQVQHPAGGCGFRSVTPIRVIRVAWDMSSRNASTGRDEPGYYGGKPLG
jgi:hypothetical protein